MTAELNALMLGKGFPPPPEDYELFYTMDNISGTTLVDESANSNDGTIIGATAVSGYIDNSLSFDGVNDRVEIPALGLTSAGFTFSCWARTTSPAVSQRIITYNNDAENIFATLAFFDGSFNLGVDDTSGTFPNILAGTVVADTWYNITATYASNDKIELFVDGVSLGTTSIATITDLGIVGQYRQVLGTNRSANGTFLSGQLDNLRIYNRVLTPEEIINIANE